VNTVRVPGGTGKLQETLVGLGPPPLVEMAYEKPGYSHRADNEQFGTFMETKAKYGGAKYVPGK
jgi:hypothetical protein